MLKLHTYKIRYDVDIENRPEGYSKEDADNKGLADGLLVMSLLYPDDGSYSQMRAASFNGKEKRPLLPDEVFKIAMGMILMLNDDGKLDGWKSKVAKKFSEDIRRVFLGQTVKNDN